MQVSISYKRYVLYHPVITVILVVSLLYPERKAEDEVVGLRAGGGGGGGGVTANGIAGKTLLGADTFVVLQKARKLNEPNKVFACVGFLGLNVGHAAVLYSN